jgi:hypothetical protein
LPGSKIHCTIYGRNLPGGKRVEGQSIDGKPLELLGVEIQFPNAERARRLRTSLLVGPSQAGFDGFEYRLKTSKGTSNPLLLGFAAAPLLFEQEPNNNPRQAQKLSPPCEVAGQFHPEGEQDWYTFDARKGEQYWIEVFSQRLGLPTDPSVLVQRITKTEKGVEESADVLELSDLDSNIGDREFNTAGRDLAGRLEVKEDGTYRVLVRDLLKRMEHSPRFVYRLSIRPPSPDFRLAAISVIPKSKADAKNIELGVPFLRRGETIAVRVMAFRQHGFNGDIELSVDQPPPGLIFRGDRIEAGKDFDFILLTAAEDAPAYAGPIRLLGKAKVGDRELVSEVRQGTLLFPVENIDNDRAEARLAREFDMAISDKESAPVIITPTEEKTWEISAAGKLQVPLQIKRHADFSGNLKLKPIGPGAAEGLKEFDVDAKATNATFTLDFAALKLSPGNYVFAAQTQVSGKYRNNPEGAAFAEAAAKEADKTANELQEALKKAATDLEAAGKAAQETEKASKGSKEKLADSQAALDKSPTEAALQEKRDQAAKAADEAVAKAKAAVETQAAAEKNKAALEAKVKEAGARKETAAGRAKAATDRAKPRDVTVLVHSAPFHVKVTPEAQAKNK